MPIQVHIARDDLTKLQPVEQDPPALADGEVLLAVESFSVTANNVTYAVVGDMVGYWNFFPAPDGKGIVPMWGHARVAESRHPDIAEGERVYGYLPMASHLVVQPGKVSASGFVDAADHRQPMSPIYNQYSRLAADPEHDPARENERMIFGPLFKTGFLIEYFMRGEDWFGAEQVVLTSASSKTAMGLASVARANSPAIRRIGLTSSGNVDFVKKSGLYDEVVAYDDVGSLADKPTVTVDFAGNAVLLRRLHEHFGDALKYSCLVGVTHIDDRGEGLGAGPNLPGPTPTLFFAPDHAVALFKELGPEEAGRHMATSWKTFLADIGNAIEMKVHDGLDAAASIFAKMVGGEVDPATGVIIKP